MDDKDWAQAPENPLNWSPASKWAMVGILSIQGYIALLASSVMAPSLPQIAAHYKISSLTVEALTLSIFVLAWAVGPLLFGPLTEVYGRRWPLIISNLVFLAFNIACIFAPNTAALIVFRFLAGLGASVPVAIGGALVGDLFVELERAAPQAVSYLGVLLGPPTGPIMGGYLAENVHFRYSFVLTSALSAVTLALALFFLRETYGPVAREHRAKLRVKALQHVLNSSDSEKAQVLSPQDQAELAHLQERAKLDVGSVLWISLLRPIQLLTQNFICFIFSLYAALIFGTLYMFFTTFPLIFPEKYGFGPGATGLTYLGGGIGELSAAIVGGVVGDRIYQKLVSRHGGETKPEYRIPAMALGSITVPVGLFWYGWSAQATIHWIMPIIGATIFGFGFICTLLPIQMYFVDTFEYSASALAGSSALRFLFGFVFPLFAPPMIDAMGLGGAYSFLAGVLLLVGVPFPLWIFYHGEKMRKASRFTL